MTRINVGIEPRRLPNPQLIAEHREIKRIPNSITKGIAVVQDIPPTFRMGKGHVKFFYDKLFYLFERYVQIRDECHDRGFNVTDYAGAWDNVPETLYNDWSPTSEDIALILERFKEKGIVLLEEVPNV